MKCKIFITLFATLLVFVISFMIFKECSDEELKEFKEIATKIYNQEYEIFSKENDKFSIHISESYDYILVKCTNVSHLGNVKAFLENNNLTFDSDTGQKDRLIISIILAFIMFVICALKFFILI